MATCKHCGATVPEQKAFCPECGSPTATQAAEQKPAQPDLGATVIVPPSKWPGAPPAQDASPTPPPAAPTPRPSPPPASAAPAPPPPSRAVAPPPPTTPAPAEPTRGSNSMVLVLGGVIVLLLIIIAFVLLRR